MPKLPLVLLEDARDGLRFSHSCFVSVPFAKPCLQSIKRISYLNKCLIGMKDEFSL